MSTPTPATHDKHIVKIHLLFLEETVYFCQSSNCRENVKQRLVLNMLQTSQTTPCWGLLVVSTSLEFLKISTYFSSNHSLYFKEERNRWPRC